MNGAIRGLVVVGVGLLLVVLLTRSEEGGPPSGVATSTTGVEGERAARSLPLALGQMLIGRYAGARPSPSLLRRVRRGQLGGVILFSDNIAAGPSATRRAIRRLQSAAQAGGNPALLVMTDQEGGDVKRIATAPPDRAPAEMRTARAARAAGRATGRALRDLGFNMNLAPVADVTRRPAVFLRTRTFGSQAARVAQLACAFADGLRAEGVAFTLKHFPGLGRAAASTDLAPQTIAAESQDLRADYAAYRRCARGPLATVMVSSAIYPRLTGDLPAVMSRRLYSAELPRARIDAPTISDDLETPAIADLDGPARRAVNAGLTMLLYASAEATSQAAYQRLRAGLDAKTVSAARVLRAARAILALKSAIAEG